MKIWVRRERERDGPEEPRMGVDGFNNQFSDHAHTKGGNKGKGTKASLATKFKPSAQGTTHTDIHTALHKTIHSIHGRIDVHMHKRTRTTVGISRSFAVCVFAV